jgi:hypothetical protein
MTELTKIISERWKKISSDMKSKYEMESEKGKEKYENEVERKDLDDIHAKLLALPAYKNWKKRVVEKEEEVPDIRREMIPILEEICKKQGLKLELLKEDLQFEWPGTGLFVKGKPVVEKELDYYLPLITFEWSLYTSPVVQRCSLKKLIIGHEVYWDTHCLTGLPDYVNFNLMYATKHFDPMYPTEVIHHEIFHFLDWKALGNNYRKDPEWVALNDPSDFKYGAGGIAYHQESKTTGTKRLADGIKGFLNYYSTTGVEEDKAEIYKSLILFPEEMLNHSDRVIKRKAETIKMRIEAFVPDTFNEEFWERCKQRSKERTWIKDNSKPNSTRFYFRYATS